MSKFIAFLSFMTIACSSMLAQGQALQKCIDDMTVEIKQEQYGTQKRCDMEAKYNADIISGKKYGGTPRERQYAKKEWQDIEAARVRHCQRRNDALKALQNRVPKICMTKASTSATYLGCFAERMDVESYGLGNRDLDGYMFENQGMTVQMCQSACRDQGFGYAGTQYASFCFCGNSYGNNGKSDNCNMPCAGDNSEICGGGWANSVYQLR